MKCNFENDYISDHQSRNANTLKFVHNGLKTMITEQSRSWVNNWKTATDVGAGQFTRA